jgi:hypothetical protein
MPLSAVDKCIANVGINPRPVRQQWELLMEPVNAAIKTLTDIGHDISARVQGKDPVEPRVRDAFFRFDGDGNGHVDADELKLALGALGFNVDIVAAEAILNHYDDDGNETLELEEFNHMVLAFEKVSKVRVEDARLEDDKDDMLNSLKKARVSKLMESGDGEVMEVRRLSQFLEQGVTGLTPRAEDSLEMTGGEERDAEAGDTIEFLRSLGVTMK